MAEFTVTIESPADTSRAESALAAFMASLEGSELALGPAVSLDIERGSLAATFQVEAPNKDEAAFRGCLAYWRAIADAGLELHGDSRVEVDPPEGEPERLVAHVSIEPEAA